MKKDRFYICEEDNVSKEVYEKLFKKGDDLRVFNVGDWAILVTAENKEAVEKDYNIKFKPFKESFVEYLKDWDEVNQLADELSKKYSILSEANPITENVQDRIIKNAANKLYAMNENNAIDFISEGNWGILLEKEIIQIMADDIIQQLDVIKKNGTLYG